MDINNYSISICIRQKYSDFRLYQMNILKNDYCMHCPKVLEATNLQLNTLDGGIKPCILGTAY